MYSQGLRLSLLLGGIDSGLATTKKTGVYWFEVLGYVITEGECPANDRDPVVARSSIV